MGASVHLETASIAPEQLRQALIAEINQIIDPCSIATALPAGLVDMGLLRDLHIEPLTEGGTRVEVKLCVTHAFCMMPAIFVHEVEKRLRAIPAITSFEVTLDGTTLWSEDLMSPEYRAKLVAQRARKSLT